MIKKIDAPFIIDLKGTELTAEDKALLAHPQVGGVIFFTRNFESTAQLKALTQTIRKINPKLLLTVDQEGGRIQRFKTGLTPIPSMGELGKAYLQDSKAALVSATTLGFTLASELKVLGIDMTFAPVLDLDRGLSAVVGDRAFSQDPDIVIALGKALMAGFRQAGMPAVGKHFPGHGSVAIDSHVGLPVDHRYLDAILQSDIKPFKALIDFGIEALMPAHIIFSKIDALPACFSKRWLSDILRGQLGFSGLIFSDCMSMNGAKSVGDLKTRTQLAQEAGCDYVLICNDRHGVLSLLS